MEFRILGPLEVDDRGRLLPVQGRRQCALLAALLLRANEVVPDERLLDDVWGEEAPRSGRAALRVRVSQLRKALAGDGGRLVTRPPGYVLQVEPEEIDARRFERLVAEGKALLSAGEAADAATRLRAALALWRGPALADFAYEPFAQSEIARLEELRLTAVEQRVDADLALGRHAELVGELEALVAAEPLRERPRAQLMLALYRAGRQAEALDVYREGRRTLVEELGLEPGRALQELESAMLRQDASLDLPAAPPPAAPAAPPAEPERKLVTVLAADVASSAELAGTADPERRSALLERLLAPARAAVEEAGGAAEAVTGDSLTAVFGAPVAQEDHVERALHAALAARRGAEAAEGDGSPLRIGVDTGDVVVGRSERGTPTIAGSPVTSAARLAAGADLGVVFVGSLSAAAAREAFEFGPPAPAAHGDRCLPLVRALTLTRERGRLRSALVGRTGELDLLRTAYRRAVEEGTPQLVTVTGDAGVGKTRVVEELWRWLSAETPPPLRRTGRCVAHGRATTYRPLADILREELGLLATDGAETVLRRLAGREILALTLGFDVAADLHPLTARDRLQSAWVELLAELTARGPLAVLVEDLHWAQEPLLELLERLLDEVPGPLLLVGTARPELAESRPSWGRRRDSTAIWVEPLAAAEAAQMLDGLGAPLPDRLRRVVLERAEGNPFFLEELLAGLLDSRALATDSGEGAATVPDSVQAVLAGRIDLLPPVEKAALQAASVIGRVFWRGPVRELLAGESPDLSVLEARDFVRRRSGSSLAGEHEYSFKHALTRDVAYAGLPVRGRARLHAGFAAWLERVGEGRDEHAPLLAHHYGEAVRPEDADLAWADAPDHLARLRGKALVWLRRAGELAVTRYELAEGIALFERALELEEGDEGSAALLRRLGRANAIGYEGQAFWEAMLRAIELTDDRETLAELHAELAFETSIRAGMWQRRPDRDLVDGWIDRALELAEPVSRARALALVAQATWNPVGSTAVAREASEIAERLGDTELRSYAWDARGITSWVAGEPDLGRSWEERRFELVDQIGDPDHRADIYYAPVTGCVWLGYFDEARRLARKHDEIVSQLTPHHRVHGVAVLLEIEELAGRWDSVRELEERVVRTMEESRSTPCIRNPRSLLLCAVANERQGDSARARALEDQADAYAMEGYGHVVDTPRMRLELQRGRLEEVERLLAEPLPDRGWHRAWLLMATHAARLDALAGLGRRDEIESWPRIRPGTYLEPFLLRALGVVREEEELVREAVARFEALRLDEHAEETRALL